MQSHLSLCGFVVAFGNLYLRQRPLQDGLNLPCLTRASSRQDYQNLDLLELGQNTLPLLRILQEVGCLLSMRIDCNLCRVKSVFQEISQDLSLIVTSLQKMKNHLLTLDRAVAFKSIPLSILP